MSETRYYLEFKTLSGLRVDYCVHKVEVEVIELTEDTIRARDYIVYKLTHDLKEKFTGLFHLKGEDIPGFHTLKEAVDVGDLVLSCHKDAIKAIKDC